SSRGAYTSSASRNFRGARPARFSGTSWRRGFSPLAAGERHGDRMSVSPGPTTRIAVSTPQDVVIRGKSLCRDLLGRLSFTEMMCFQILGRVPGADEVAVIDACLVALMEHGLTPSVLATRLVYSSAPEALQAAVSAGLTAVGSVFAGTMDGCGRLLARLVAAPAAGAAEEARRIAREHQAARLPVPGFG